MSRRSTANFLLVVSIVLLSAAIVALATGAPSLQRARSFIPVAIIFSIVSAMLKNKAREGG